VLWPDHCVQGTPDAELHRELRVPHAELIIRKGYRQQMDSYSAFYEADGRTPTGLTGYLRERGLGEVYLVGLATDFCVAWSALDARKAGFGAAVIEDATRGIDAGGSLAKAWQDMTGAGVRRLTSSDIAL
jgi:nicotinamidase/pyrazinamidase